MPEIRVDDALPVPLPDPVRAALVAPMVDHHCHGVRRDDLSRSEFETLITEAGTPAPPGTTHFDTPAGMAIRRWCAPALDLEPHVSPAVYLSRRAELGAAEVNRRLLRKAGIAAFLVDTGLDRPELLSAAEMGRTGGAAADEVVRLEQIEQEVATAGLSAVGYVKALRDELAVRAARAVGLKSIAAYRCGLGFDPSRPSRGAVIASAGRRLSDPKERLTDPVLVRHLLWAAVDVARERSLPLQFHCGYGDADLDLHRSDPSLLTGFIRAVAPSGMPVVLLHCYPFHRQAAYLAAVFPHVYVDVGLALTYTAAGSAAILGEMLELVPFHKQMFSSDCYGVAELCLLGAVYHRRGLARVLAGRIAEGEWSAADAARIAHMIGSGNARRVYRL
ncbi:amidohydrolase [Planotetraspora silvatica]|uniref:Amidohydrolase n=1 Tax=Planotetraspora silvatica TaxID=234614 RepID=A0A8J3XTI9_9ACTN|nr:amidohydrolase family protein [Planotetraspora silvatica]GII48453.1 amidohydrolase [Planotetraspora silvatica]